MNCPNCHQPLQPNASFCSSCGQSIASAAASGRVQATAPDFIARVKNIVLSPHSEWEVIAPESTTLAQLYTGYVILLSALAAVIAFVHLSVIGANLPFGGGVLRYPLGSGLTATASNTAAPMTTRMPTPDSGLLDAPISPAM